MKKRALFLPAFAMTMLLLAAAPAAVALVGDIAPLHLTVAPSHKSSVTQSHELSAGQANTFTLALTTPDGKTLSPADLAEVHTKKFHLLIISETLTDYIHAHPVYDAAAKTYAVTFTPKENTSYKAWADITTAADGRQYFLPHVFAGKKSCAAGCAVQDVSMVSQSGDVTATMTLDKPLSAGAASMAEIVITGKDGQKLSDLEPVMGAFAHLVSFSGDLKDVIHAHPTGAEPTDDTQRGGPTLGFHLEANRAGYTKFYLQIRRTGQDIYLPFGMTVTAAAETPAPAHDGHGQHKH